MTDISEKDIQVVLKWLDGGCSSWGVPSDQIHKLCLAHAALEAQLAEARKALWMMLREHDTLSGNFGDVMDPKHKRPDRWPTAAEAARRALEGGKEDG